MSSQSRKFRKLPVLASEVRVYRCLDCQRYPAARRRPNSCPFCARHRQGISVEQPWIAIVAQLSGAVYSLGKYHPPLRVIVEAVEKLNP